MNKIQIELNNLKQDYKQLADFNKYLLDKIKEMETNGTLWTIIYDEISMLNDAVDDDEKLTDDEIKTATDRFYNGNYIWQLIDDDILNIMNDIRHERK